MLDVEHERMIRALAPDRARLFIRHIRKFDKFRLQRKHPAVLWQAERADGGHSPGVRPFSRWAVCELFHTHARTFASPALAAKRATSITSPMRK